MTNWHVEHFSVVKSFKHTPTAFLKTRNPLINSTKLPCFVDRYVSSRRKNFWNFFHLILLFVMKITSKKNTQKILRWFIIKKNSIRIRDNKDNKQVKHLYSCCHSPSESGYTSNDINRFEYIILSNLLGLSRHSKMSSNLSPLNCFIVQVICLWTQQSKKY